MSHADEFPEPFAELLARVRAGDEQAMSQLVARYEARLRLAARVLLGPALQPHLDSVDLTQSAFRTLLAGLKQEKFDFSSPEQLLALLLTVVRRKVARQWRKSQRQQRLSLPEEAADAFASLASAEAPPESRATVNDSIAQLLVGLSDIDRRMIELRLDGHSTVEVAQLLGLDSRVLRARLSRLRQRLREEGLLSEWL